MTKPSDPSSVRLKSKHPRRGAAAFELAVLSPLLVAIFVGAVDVGQYVHVSQTVSNASREGARLAARYETTTVSQMQSAVSDYLAASFPKISSTTLAAAVRVTVSDGNSNTIPAGDMTNVPTGAAVNVEVVLPFDTVRWVAAVPFLNNKTLSTSTASRRE